MTRTRLTIIFLTLAASSWSCAGEQPATNTAPPANTNAKPVEKQKVTHTIGTYDPATATFTLKGSGAAPLTFAFGPPNARPVAGDWEWHSLISSGYAHSHQLSIDGSGCRLPRGLPLYNL